MNGHSERTPGPWGLTTYIRLVAVNHDETRWVLGMNRIRAAYLELAPELERWFITSHHDDAKGAAATAGLMTFPTLFGYVTTPAAVGVIDAVVAGVITFLGTRALGLQAVWRRRSACWSPSRGIWPSPPIPGGRTDGGRTSTLLSVPPPRPSADGAAQPGTNPSHPPHRQAGSTHQSKCGWSTNGCQRRVDRMPHT